MRMLKIEAIKQRSTGNITINLIDLYSDCCGQQLENREEGKLQNSVN